MSKIKINGEAEEFDLADALRARGYKVEKPKPERTEVYLWGSAVYGPDGKPGVRFVPRSGKTWNITGKMFDDTTDLIRGAFMAAFAEMERQDMECAE